MPSSPAPGNETTPRPWWSLFDPRASLRARAALFAGGAVVVFVVLITWFAGNTLRRTLESEIGSTFETLAFQVSDKIDRGLYERQHQLQLIANLSAFRHATSGPDGAAERRVLLEALQHEHPDLAWIGFADLQGHIAAATQGRFEGEQVPTRPWFRGARELPFVGPPHDIPELPRAGPNSQGDPDPRFLDLAVPVFAADGRLSGILGAHLRWAWAGDIARSVVTEAALRQQIGVTLYAGDTEALLDTGVSGWTVPPNAPPVPGPRVTRGHLRENFALGTRYLTGFARSRGYRDYRSLNWLAAVRQPIARTFAPVGELQRRIARWGLGFTVVLTLGAWFAADPFVRRIQGMRAAAVRIREGDVLTVMPRHAGESEVSTMCDAVGDLVEQLRAESARPVEPPPPAPTPPSGYVKPGATDPRRVVW
jgi:hypothetical protein